MELGATVTEVAYRGRPVALAYGHAADYLQHGAYLGAIVGRFANRIGGGRFPLGGKTIELQKNENGNTLHGGPNSYDKRRWEGVNVNEGVRFTLISPDGDNGFPGRLKMHVDYAVRGGELRVDYRAVSDADTIYAPTNHSYFNLDGAENILGTTMQIKARGVLEVDGELIPTGTILPAEGDFDFSAPRAIGRNYDHCFVLAEGAGEKAAVASAGGVTLSVSTDFPSIQFYTGGALGSGFHASQGFALEPGYCADTPNRPEFGSCTLKAGEEFHKYIRYEFT
jgi:aldose 1-epimerase